MNDIQKTDDIQKTEYLDNIYYTEKRKLGRDRLFHYVSKTLNNKMISRPFIARYLKSQVSNQIFTQMKKATMIRPILTSKPGAMLQIDLIDYSKKPSNKYKFVLNLIDTYSRKVFLISLRNKEMKSINIALEKIIKEFLEDYTITVIQSDNGVEFNSVKFLAEKYDFKYIRTRAYNPQANSLVERSNGTLKRILNKIIFDAKTKRWDTHIKTIQDIYNTSVNRITGKTPDELYFEASDEIQKEVYEKVKLEKAKGYKEIDIQLKVGDRVRVLNEKNQVDKKKGLPIWSTEVYTIKQVIKGNKKTFSIPRYKVGNFPNTFPLSKLLLEPKEFGIKLIT